MTAKKKTMSSVKQILRLYIDKKPIKTIAKICGISKNTVKTYIRSPAILGVSLLDLVAMDDKSLEELFHKPTVFADKSRHEYFLSRCEYWYNELQRVGVTRYLLWQEYRLLKHDGYSYTQFCHHLQLFKKASSSSMVMDHKPAERLYIDFTGKKMNYYDPRTGEEKKAEILVACLGFSQKSFVIALESQRSDDFIAGMVKILGYLGGCTHAIVPDNMKTAVIKSDRYEPAINQAFEDFANHYQTTIIPTRALHPKDKALAENLVKISYSRVFAPLRDQMFVSIEDLNAAIIKQVDAHNATAFQRKDHSRNDLFESNERAMLKPLPTEPFALKKYREYTVQKNSHIFLSEDNHYYSVPYAYQGQKVDVVYTHTQVSIYVKGGLVAQHIRRREKYEYSSVEGHLPSKYKDYKDRSPEYYRQRARSYNADLQEVINKALLRKLLPEQNYKSCDGIFSLAKKTEPIIFQNACKIALLADSCHYRFIEKIIHNGTAKNYEPQPDIKPSPEHNNIRGKEFFNKITQIFK